MKNNLHKQFTVIYWINLALFVIGFLILLQIKGPDFGSDVKSNITFERYAIIITLASIPLALKLFHSIISKAKESTKNISESIYKKAFFVRLSILDCTALMNIIGFQLYEANNFIYMTIVVVSAMLFCYPNKNILQSENSTDTE